jgi:hypothetical protein
VQNQPLRNSKPALVVPRAPKTFSGNIASIQLNGDALLRAVDSSGNASTPLKCKWSHQSGAFDNQTYKPPKPIL